MKRTLGTCYYPEHWPEEIWVKDAARMVEMGLTWVRIGEFAWSRIEPSPGQFDWGWLDRAVDTLTGAGLQVMLGTPTATPPRWMLDKHPDMIALDDHGHPRRFGSRRHYCFSHEPYARECDSIVEQVARRYGGRVAAWQTDNEYGCHDTVLSYSDAARDAFRDWLRARYGDIDALNAAWGNVFWSMEYDRFDQIELPNLTVTEPNPSHAFDFRRFSSDQVIRFNARQARIIAAHSDAPISHNFMGRVTEFDHHAMGPDLQIATWDSYPLGFLEDRVGADPDWQRRFARQGDPDFQAFHHDLYRGITGGRWWVVEQQPGPVNWAPYNPAPLPGMVRLWTWEAFAHGAEAVCYFRWRQVPFAQEQKHAGLLRPDHAEAQGAVEARQVAAELTDAPEVTPQQAPVALVFDYASDWAWDVQPHGEGLSYFGLIFDTYRALRRLGLSIDIVGPEADLTGYALVLVPGVIHLSEALATSLANHAGHTILGPRSAARVGNMRIPNALPPALPDLDITVDYVESLRPDSPRALRETGHATRYLEALTGAATPVLTTTDGTCVAMQQDKTLYLGTWLDPDGMAALFTARCDAAGIATQPLPDVIRRRETGTEIFWFNYDTEAHQVGALSLPPISVTRTSRATHPVID